MADGITISLTTEELTKYNSQKRKELPNVYSTASSSFVPISRDMEAFLILEDFNFKNTVVDSIQAILKNDEREDESELFEEAWNNERDITRNEIADLNSKLGTTVSVKQGIRSSKFVNVEDIANLFSAISSEQSVLSIRQRISQFHLVYLEQFKTKYKSEEKTNEENLKAAESWLTPLKTY